MPPLRIFLALIILAPGASMRAGGQPAAPAKLLAGQAERELENVYLRGNFRVALMRPPTLSIGKESHVQRASR